jgi:hypothetical protein
LPIDATSPSQALNPLDQPGKLQWQHREDAQPLLLHGKAVSPAAQAFVEGLVQQLVAQGGVAARPSSTAKLHLAVAAIVAGLLKHEIEELWGAHGTSPKNFTSLPFGRQIFLQATEGLDALGYLDVMPGWPRWMTSGGKPFNHGGRVSRFRLTKGYVSRALEAGVALSDWKVHWTKGPSQKVTISIEVPRLVLRGASRREGPTRIEGPTIEIAHGDERATELREGVMAHNAYLDQCTIGGVSFPGLRRIFNDGDQPGLKWRRGGRYFSVPGGEAYDLMSGEERRSELTLDGEPVGEVDLAASHLTLLYALLGEAFDARSDPYAILNHDRELVKNWLTHALGTSSPFAVRWSRKARDDYAKVQPQRVLRKDFPIGSVREAILNRHPILYRLETSGISTLDLQYHESEILRMAMEELRETHDVPSLPIHDGLIVAFKHLQVAEGELVRAFGKYIESETGQVCQVIPSVKRKVAISTS